ncbi:MAG: hypothetical protein IJS61_03380 [Firmicutes bacterium]|nr:hypothetical protein [Bacillota bacterium]
MNRAQRRAMEKEQRNNEVPAEFERVVKRASQESRKRSMAEAFAYMLAIPAMVVRDKCGFGAKRLNQFVDWVVDLSNSVETFYVTIDDLKQTIFEETGVSLEDSGKSLRLACCREDKNYRKAMAVNDKRKRMIVQRIRNAMANNGATVKDIVNEYEMWFFGNKEMLTQRVEDLLACKRNFTTLEITIFSNVINVSSDYLLGLSERM